VRHLLQLTLAPRHTVIEAEDGDEALALLRQHRPDVAILDVTMSVRDGLEVCRLIRSDPDLRDTAVIVISGNAGEGDALAAGADRFLAKPFLPSVLLRAVEALTDRPGIREAAPACA
jgi:CheY-like chemotaxis protein